MGFWSDFAVTWNEISDCTFNTIIYDCHEQSTKIGEKYQALLQNPNFRTTQEVKNIMRMSSKEARKAFGINLDADKSATEEAKKPRKRSCKTRNQPQQSN